MRTQLLGGLIGVCAVSIAAHGEITLIGRASIPGTALDKCPFTQTLEGGVEQNRLGSFGSGIEYLGKDELYVACDDRGPADGAAAFRARLETFRIHIEPGSAPPTAPVTVELVKTTMLVGEKGEGLVGMSSAFDAEDQRRGLRFDAESVRLSAGGNLWLSDEYGPWIDEFSMEGKRLRRLSIPAKFLVEHPGPTPASELPPNNTHGRQTNHGFEGLAVSPDRGTLWAFLQAPLIQDGALNAEGKKVGVNARVLEIVPATGATREMVYVLDDHHKNVNEAIAVDDHRMLVIERDSKAAKERALMLVDIAGASDVSKIAALPTTGLPEGVKPIAKKKWLDFMDEKFGLREGMPEKIEGLAFGPTLADGRRTLVVTTDNDLVAEKPSWFWVFAFGAEDLK